MVVHEHEIKKVIGGRAVSSCGYPAHLLYNYFCRYSKRETIPGIVLPLERNVWVVVFDWLIY
jgi:hypothetical protein